jgi:hypothetical protein
VLGPRQFQKQKEPRDDVDRRLFFRQLLKELRGCRRGKYAVTAGYFLADFF